MIVPSTSSAVISSSNVVNHNEKINQSVSMPSAVTVHKCCLHSQPHTYTQVVTRCGSVKNGTLVGFIPL